MITRIKYRRRGHIPTEWVGCGAPLRPHNLTRLCAECKLVARDRRLSDQPADTANPVSHVEAITNITHILGGRIIADHHLPTTQGD